MSFFRYVGDFVHLASILVLIVKMRNTKNCVGLSCKTQEIYLIVFLTRYSDLFLYFVSLYNLTMKLAFIGLTGALVFFMRFKKPYCLTYDSESDSFNYLMYLLPPCAVLALIFPAEWTLYEMIWTFSIFLESVSILPQLTMLQKMGQVENMTSHYVFLLGAYRLLYILNWVFKYASTGYFNYVSLMAGII